MHEEEVEVVQQVAELMAELMGAGMSTTVVVVGVGWTLGR